MRENQTQSVTLQNLTCRRGAPRISMPVEVQFTTGGRRVTAIIRDVSLNGAATAEVIGIGILHKDFLPLDEPLLCQTDSEIESLPKESEVTLMWTRHFGSHGYLSGGRLAGRSVDTDGGTELPGQT